MFTKFDNRYCDTQNHMNMYIAHNALTGIVHVLPHDIDVTNGLRIKTIISALRINASICKESMQQISKCKYVPKELE